jgi:hypothetical protein
MNEVSYDQLLGVEFLHPITCPMINPLKFSGLMSSKIYKVEIDYDPSELKVRLKELLLAMSNLDSWSKGLLHKTDQLPEDLKSNFKLKNIFSIKEIKELIDTDYKEYLIEKASEINSLIESWVEYRNDYYEVIDNIKLKKQEIEETEKELLLISFSEVDRINDIQGLLNYYKEELEELDDDKKDFEHKFERYVKDDFINETTEFSELLETVRDRNDNLRVKISDLRQDIIKIGKEYFKLYQPVEYLNMIKPEKENEINIGVLFNGTETDYRTPKVSYFNMLARICKKEAISFLEKGSLMDMYDNKSKNEILESLSKLLNKKGFNVIRYYFNEQDFLTNKDNYLVTEMKSRPKAKP